MRKQGKSFFHLYIPFPSPKSRLIHWFRSLPIVLYQWEMPEEYANYEEELDHLEEQQHRLQDPKLQPLSSPSCMVSSCWLPCILSLTITTVEDGVEV